jgi:hypothetical protein
MKPTVYSRTPCDTQRFCLCEKNLHQIETNNFHVKEKINYVSKRQKKCAHKKRVEPNDAHRFWMFGEK